MIRKLAVMSLALVFAASSSSQQIGQNKPADAQDTFTLSVKVQLVVEAVVVKDKQGNPVHRPHGERLLHYRSTTFRRRLKSASTRISPRRPSRFLPQNAAKRT